MANQYYTINTGDRVRERYSQVTRFNGQSQLPESWWSPMGPTPSLHRAGYGGMCRGIHGTDGQQFHPMVKHGEDMWLFTPDLCRSSYSRLIQTTVFIAGVSGWNISRM